MTENIGSEETKHEAGSEGRSTMIYLVSIALAISLIALVVAVIGLFGANRMGFEVAKESGSYVAGGYEDFIGRMAAIEKKAKADEKTMTARGMLELRKAMLGLEEARNLIDDEAISKRLIKIEDELKSLLAGKERKAPEEKGPEGSVEPAEKGAEVMAPSIEKEKEVKKTGEE